MMHVSGMLVVLARDSIILLVSATKIRLEVTCLQASRERSYEMLETAKNCC